MLCCKPVELHFVCVQVYEISIILTYRKTLTEREGSQHVIIIVIRQLWTEHAAVYMILSTPTLYMTTTEILH